MRNYTYPGLSVGSMLCLPSFQRIMSNFSLKVNIFIAIFTRITITQHFLIFFILPALMNSSIFIQAFKLKS